MITDFLSSLRYFATRNQSEWRDYGVADPQADALYQAAGRTVGATQRARAVPTISGSRLAKDFQPDADGGTLITPQRFHPAPTMLFKNIFGPPLQNRPAGNLTHFMNTSGYGGVMPLDAQPFVNKVPAYLDATRGRG